MGAFSTGRFVKGLLALVATFVAAVLVVGALNARTDEYQPGYPKLGQDSELVYGHDPYRDGALGTQLLTVHIDDRGGRILAYRIELNVHPNWGGELQQTDFPAFPDSNESAKSPQVRSKVSWITHRSYPQTGIAQVAAAAGVPGSTEREAITAIQATIWHLTDNFTLNGLHSWEAPRHDTESGRAQRIKKLYDYLLGPVNTGLPESSGPSVEVTTPKAPGTGGEPVSPIRLTATQQTVALAVLPYPLVDVQGNEMDPSVVPTGTDLFLKVPADTPAGKVDITASLTGDTHTSHLLVAQNGRWQTLIIAKTKQVTVIARGEISWAPAEAPNPSPSPSPSPTPSASTPTPGPGIPAKKPGLPRTGS